MSLQHLESAPLVQLERAGREVVIADLAAQHVLMRALLAGPLKDLPIRLNRSALFGCGGPMNENGQTGPTFVYDFYGPLVPIGGGALSRKDP